MEKERHKTNRIAGLVLIGVLVIVAVVVWSMFYSKSQAPVEPAATPPATAKPQPSETVVEKPLAAPETVPASEAGAPNAEEAPHEGTLQPEEPPQVDMAEETPAPEGPIDLAAEDEPAAQAQEAEEEPAPSAEATETPTEEEAEAPVPEAPAEPEKPLPTKEALPKITFMDEKVEESFRSSRFFTSNQVAPSGNPFAPPSNKILPRDLEGAAEQLESMLGATELQQQGVEPGEIPLLPLPGEAIGAEIQVRLIGISQSGDTATAMFAVSGGEGEKIIMAHAGWLVGNEYMFIGAENGLARMFDRKSNKIIHLATGETL